jgi:DNA-binding NarL/FixJ family response regulator
MPIRIAVIDDNPTLLRSILHNLAIFDEIKVICTALDGEQAVLQVGQYQPQVVLMDIEMPVMNGISATSLIHQQWPHIKVLMLTVLDRDDKLFEAIKAGASGYLLKDERPAQLVQAIEEVLNGGAPMSPGIALKTLHMLRHQTIVENTQPKSLELVQSPEAYALTAREVSILELIVEGQSLVQIADQLFISTGTVRKHIENFYNKLHVHSRLEAIRLAEQNHWFNKSN